MQKIVSVSLYSLKITEDDKRAFVEAYKKAIVARAKSAGVSVELATSYPQNQVLSDYNFYRWCLCRLATEAIGKIDAKCKEGKLEGNTKSLVCRLAFLDAERALYTQKMFLRTMFVVPDAGGKESELRLASGKPVIGNWGCGNARETQGILDYLRSRGCSATLWGFDECDVRIKDAAEENPEAKFMCLDLSEAQEISKFGVPKLDILILRHWAICGVKLNDRWESMPKMRDGARLAFERLKKNGVFCITTYEAVEMLAIVKVLAEEGVTYETLKECSYLSNDDALRVPAPGFDGPFRDACVLVGRRSGEAKRYP